MRRRRFAAIAAPRSTTCRHRSHRAFACARVRWRAIARRGARAEFTPWQRLDLFDAREAVSSPPQALRTQADAEQARTASNSSAPFGPFPREKGVDSRLK